MLHTPASENKQPGDPTRTRPSQEKGREVHPHSGAVPGRTAKRAAILQRSIGNQAVLRLLDQRARNPLVAPQAKPVVGPAKGPLGQEVDRVAEKACGVFVDGAPQALPASAVEVLAEAGLPLEPSARTLMESRFDADFGSVRVHTGTASERATQDLHTRAWASGEHVVFGNEAFGIAPLSRRNRLAHELAHVLEHRRNGQQALAIAREPLSPKDQFRIDQGLPIEGMDPLTGEFFDGHIDPEITERYLRGLRKGEVYKPAKAPTLATVPAKMSESDCGTVKGGMDPAKADVIRNCITHRRFVNIMAQSSANIAAVPSTYSAGISSIYGALINQIVSSSQVPTDTASEDYTVTGLSVRVSAATTIPIATFTLTLAHLPSGNGSWNLLTGKLTLNETSGSALTQNQADIERTMYHEMVHFLSDAVTFAASKKPAGAPAIQEPALMSDLTAAYQSRFVAASTPIFKDMLATVKLASGASSSPWTAGQLANAHWFRVENEMIARVEEQIYLALRDGRGFTTADMRALPQEWLLATPEYWDSLAVFDRDSLAAYLKTNRKRTERDILPIVQAVQERYMYLRRPS